MAQMKWILKKMGVPQQVMIGQCDVQIDYIHKQCSALQVKDHQKMKEE